MTNANYVTLQGVVAESGLWKGFQRDTHKFLLSPSVFELSKSRKQELDKLAHAFADCMLGLSHISVIAFDGKLNYQGAWLLARRVFATGVPKIYQELQGMNTKHIPKMLKVDMMIDSTGRLRVAEIDGHNKHGVGYSTLCSRFRKAMQPGAEVLPGFVQTISEEVTQQGRTEVKLFYADQERFYLPEFQIAAQEFAKHGITCHVVSEMDATEEFLSEGLFLDLPFLYKRRELYQAIIPAYKRGEVSFMISPKPFFGAKGVMSLLRNDGEDQELEALLRSFIKRGSLDLVRSYIPETFLVGKQATRIKEVSERIRSKRYVLKESISSGMKGVFFSDEADFQSALIRADSSNMNWVLQEQVENQSQTFSSFIEDGKGGTVMKTEDGWYMRVIAQFVGRNLADVIITARKDRAVHGGKDCIQLGSVLVD